MYGTRDGTRRAGDIGSGKVPEKVGVTRESGIPRFFPYKLAGENVWHTGWYPTSRGYWFREGPRKSGGNPRVRYPPIFPVQIGRGKCMAHGMVPDEQGILVPGRSPKKWG